MDNSDPQGLTTRGTNINPQCELNELRYTESWKGTHAGLPVEIKLWGFGKKVSSYLPEKNWNYYVIIPERETTRFAEIWLPARIIQSSPESKGWVTHVYSNNFVANCDWHGGVTYYAKYGELEGHRAVEFGCDFMHAWDLDHGPFTLEEVLWECRTTAEQIRDQLNSPLDTPQAGE